ncbi:Hypothetical protein, predicted transmembrane protein [Metamycoplasma auris 15026]|uniref:Uncharacterized protein n=1 Tax=Metamycoplasma auris 15026 TaxID=1188233 RepID=N9TST2_9BACT|nr:hypothetical protein [Metamycoplasma auris]ENY69140.1 Hypothetical protein, predicted transmembrane protein [Metamycoplasma auris 15026]
MTTFLAEATEANTASETIKKLATPIFDQVFKIGSIIIGIIVAILAISCIFAAISAQFKLKSGDSEAAAVAKKRMKNILIAFLVGFAILALFSGVMLTIGKVTGIMSTPSA